MLCFSDLVPWSHLIQLYLSVHSTLTQQTLHLQANLNTLNLNPPGGRSFDDSKQREVITIITAPPKLGESYKPQPERRFQDVLETAKKAHDQQERRRRYPNLPLYWLDDVALSDGEVDDITIVTSYINLGRYSNPHSKLSYSPEVYRNYMKVFGKINNPVVAFMNDRNDIALFEKIREGVPFAKTKVELVHRLNLWSFDINIDIQRILRTPGFRDIVTKPHRFLSVMHGKYEYLALAMKGNYFKTKYYCWLDMDLFGSIINTTSDNFSLHVPKNFDDTKVAYAQVSGWENLKPEAIFKQNKTWVGGSTILGRASVMKNMVKQYITYTMDYINDTLINSDSQVVYAMHQNSKKLSVTAQAFPVDDRYKLGDQLAFLMKEAGQF